jgi:endonuclease/exonuclease/phosphatase family metal-dependent hydrolase
MTFNVAGGKMEDLSGGEGSQGGFQPLVAAVQHASPDVLVLQEATEWQLADGATVSLTAHVAGAAGFDGHHYFHPTVSLKQHMRVTRPFMVEALFHDVLDWRLGNSVLVRGGFVQLGDPSCPGTPRSVPLFRAPLYEGDRNTEPRDAVLARANYAPVYPFVVGTHLTTLTAERGAGAEPEAASRAREIRAGEAERILALLDAHVLRRQEVVLLLGDFNAERDEPSIAAVLEGRGGFQVLSGTELTHRTTSLSIDHILVYPRHRLLDYRCWTVDCPASDHSAVVADVVLR